MIVVGVDIGSSSIKIAEVESTSKSYIVRAVNEIPLSQDPNRDRKIQIIDALRTLFPRYSADTQFVFAVPQKFISARLLYLPFRERFKVQKASVALLEDELPFSQEDAIFDAKIVQFKGKGADVLAFAVPREHVMESYNLARDCGVDAHLISSEAVAIFNIFENWMEPPREVPLVEQEIPEPRPGEMVLNIGHLNTQILVMSDGELIATRSLDWGAKNIADAIAAKYSINSVQAMAELRNKGAILLDKAQGNREQVAFSQVIEGAFKSFVADLRLKMLEVQSEFHLQWSKVQLLGGASNLRHLNGFLTQMLNLQVNRCKHFELHPQLAFEGNPALESISAVAIGLAIEGLKRPRNPATNFLKGELMQKAHLATAVWERWGYTARVLASAFVIFFVYAMIRDTLAQHLLEASEAALKTQAEVVAGIKGKQINSSRINKFISNSEKLSKTRKQAEKLLHLNSAMDVVNLVTASVPAKDQIHIEVKRFTIHNDQVEVHGTVANEGERQVLGKTLARAAQGGVQPIDSKVPAAVGRVSFAYRFKTNRWNGG